MQTGPAGLTALIHKNLFFFPVKAAALVKFAGLGRKAQFITAGHRVNEGHVPRRGHFIGAGLEGKKAKPCHQDQTGRKPIGELEIHVSSIPHARFDVDVAIIGT